MKPPTVEAIPTPACMAPRAGPIAAAAELRAPPIEVAIAERVTGSHISFLEKNKAVTVNVYVTRKVKLTPFQPCKVNVVSSVRYVEDFQIWRDKLVNPRSTLPEELPRVFDETF
jgi:hypothetical protein